MDSVVGERFRIGFPGVLFVGTAANTGLFRLAVALWERISLTREAHFVDTKVAAIEAAFDALLFRYSLPITLLTVENP
ncbi:hypothetical protein [Rubripirellula lacrimiformis]|uniref:hypothetical protein n=1 Tax=Rubripirellula lacrimiformis TaxID=1930273 RepID=UPI0011A2D1B5|nr:hypothetical protein [Rubripirellula lacrimiformis]